MSWEGRLIDLTEGKCLFYSKGTNGKVLLFIAGLGDGFFTVPYTRYLPQLLHEIGWGFAQAIIRSSYNNFGRFTLQDEAEDLREAIEYLLQHHMPSEIVLMGHSSGCQDILQYLLTTPTPPSQIRKIILQGPVSDRESPSAPQLTSPVEDYFVVPGWLTLFTQARYHSLFDRGGADDMFSSDLAAYVHLQNVKLPCLVLFSEHDEYVPAHVDKSLLLSRWKHANCLLQCHLLPDSHFLPDQSLFLQHCLPLIMKFISSSDES